MKLKTRLTSGSIFVLLLVIKIDMHNKKENFQEVFCLHQIKLLFNRYFFLRRYEPRRQIIINSSIFYLINHMKRLFNVSKKNNPTTKEKFYFLY